MKKIIIILIFFTSLLYSNEIKYIYSYDKALNIAKDENKTIMFVTSIVNCPVCDYLKDIVFQREKIVDYMNDNYVLVVKDIETQFYPERFFTTNAPMFYFIDPHTEKEIVEPKIGGTTPEKFLDFIKNVIETKNQVVNL